MSGDTRFAWSGGSLHRGHVNFCDIPDAPDVGHSPPMQQDPPTPKNDLLADVLRVVEHHAYDPVTDVSHFQIGPITTALMEALTIVLASAGRDALPDIEDIAAHIGRNLPDEVRKMMGHIEATEGLVAAGPSASPWSVAPIVTGEVH